MKKPIYMEKKFNLEKPKLNSKRFLQKTKTIFSKAQKLIEEH
jgi:hypothetical protein